MKNLPILIFGILCSLAFSVMGVVLSSHIQLGGLTQTTEVLDELGNPTAGDPLYPAKMPGNAQQGEAVYADLGCVACHTQQVRRPLKKSSAEGETVVSSDIEREWGKRHTVARDYVTQGRVLIGSKRVGPDLKTVGERRQDKNWHHLHLYNPKATSGGLSIMPQFAFLYDTRAIEGTASANALKFPEGSPFAPAAGYEVVPSPRAEALVEYLLSLKLNYSLPEAQIPEE
jgi:cytochrome c oxidase cbb3-type subunit 2